jgi:hypothetical protein
MPFSFSVRDRGRGIWTRLTKDKDPRQKFIFTEDQNIKGNPYVDFRGKQDQKQDQRKLNLQTGELN